MTNLAEEAVAIGFTDAVWLNDLHIECESRLRAYCNPEGCPNHGLNWVCPPGCGSLEDCAAKVSRFDKGILLRSVSKLGLFNKDYQGLNRAHNFRLRELIEKHCNGTEVLALTSGGCVFCDTCVYPAPCVKPAVRMNSLSAYGIDAGRLCELAGLEYSFRPDRVHYVALILVS